MDINGIESAGALYSLCINDMIMSLGGSETFFILLMTNKQNEKANFKGKWGSHLFILIKASAFSDESWGYNFRNKAPKGTHLLYYATEMESDFQWWNVLSLALPMKHAYKNWAMTYFTLAFADCHVQESSFRAIWVVAMTQQNLVLLEIILKFCRDGQSAKLAFLWVLNLSS